MGREKTDKKGMERFAVVLVEPLYPGNVGSVARAMKNFGVKKLCIVGEIDLAAEDAKKMAMHAYDVLENARFYTSLKEALREFSLSVATSAASSSKEKRSIRHPMMPWDLREKLSETEGSVALVFGREDYGLYNAELSMCDLLVTIPTSPEYPVMNLSHAVAVVLYELSRGSWDRKTTVRLASGEEKEHLYRFFDELLAAERFPVEKRERARGAFRRMVSRAMISTWDFHTLSGVIMDAVKRIRDLERRLEDWERRRQKDEK